MAKGVPKAQIDNGLGTVKCPKCKGLNYAGAYMCGHEKCSGLLPSVKIPSSGEPVQSTGGMDYSKLTPQDIEARVSYDEKKVKRAGFERRMDRVNAALRKATTESEHKRLSEVQATTMRLYKKYS